MYYHKITEYEIKCCMHAHHVPSSRGELYRRKTLFLDDFPIFFYYPNGTWTHPPTSKLFLDFWNFFNFAKPLKTGVLFVERDIKERHPRKSRHYVVCGTLITFGHISHTSLCLHWTASRYKRNDHFRQPERPQRRIRVAREHS